MVVFMGNSFGLNYKKKKKKKEWRCSLCGVLSDKNWLTHCPPFGVHYSEQMLYVCNIAVSSIKNDQELKVCNAWKVH